MSPAKRRSTRPVDPSVRQRKAEFELPEVLLRHRKAVRIALHCVLIPWGYLLAFGLRFDFAIEPRYLDAMWVTLPALLVARLAAFGVFRVYNGWWRHTGLYDLVDLARAITVGSMLFVALLFLTRLTGIVPRSILLLEWGIAIVNFGGIRFTVRWFQETKRQGTRDGRRALIVGADDTAATFIREIRKNPRSGLNPIGLVDDDPLKASLQLHGVSVLGTTADLQRLVQKHQIRLVIVAIPNPTRQVMRKIAERCAHAGVELKLVPTLSELLHGTARIGQLQAVRVEDLLGRSPVALGLEQVANDVGGKVVLITGGAGSIGSELARQLSAFRPARLILVEQAESPLYFIHLELARKHPELEVVPVVADVTNRSRMGAIFAEHRPDYVFHAAAYKHVPMLETNVAEAMRNNICGTLNTAQLSARHGVGKFVLISTDKAVKPSSVMGATKRAAERLVLELPELGAATDVRVVRFGNVLGSDGSVVPLFKQQIAAGGPVTVTHPDVTRYFMTIPEAVQLVLQAAALPETSGRIAMLEMGRPMRILELAETLIRLSGFEPYVEMPIIFTGLRPGEKMHEELVSLRDAMTPTTVDRIWILSDPMSEGTHVRGWIERLDEVIERRDAGGQLLALGELVPECVSPLRDRLALAARHTDPPSMLLPDERVLSRP